MASEVGREIAPIVEFVNVSYMYKGSSTALAGVTFSIGQGRRTAIVGGNGAGKSTVVFHMNGLFEPSSGEIRFRGEAVDRKLRGRLTEHVGVVFQDPDDQIVSMTVLEDVMFGPAQRGVDSAEAQRLAQAYLERLGIEHLAGANPNELSYGQRKTVAIAGVLAMETEVVVFDEPMAFLDPAGKKELQRIMDELAAEGRTVVITTHDMQLVAEWADEVVVMKSGQCLGVMNATTLFANANLLAETKLELPPIASLAAALWTGDKAAMPIRLEALKTWLLAERD